MRLFTGIAIPPEIVANLSVLLDRLRPSARVRWCPNANFHITTKFIGEWPAEKLAELSAALQPLGRRPPIPIGVSGIGWIPNPHSPRILFAAIQGGDALAGLARDTAGALEPLGIAQEAREFRPHLTLARLGDAGVPLGPLRRAVADLPSTDFGFFTASGFELYLSKPGAGGSIYTRLAEIPFSQ